MHGDRYVHPVLYSTLWVSFGLNIVGKVQQLFFNGHTSKQIDIELQNIVKYSKQLDIPEIKQSL